MSTPYEALPERIAFGKVIRRWFRSNNWAQDVPHRLAKFTGAAGPWNSQISTVMAGKLDPKCAFFVAFGAFNQTVAEQSFKGVTDRRLLDQLKGAEPLRDDSGRVCTAPEFFAMFAGLTELPQKHAAHVEITEDEAKARSEAQRQAFQRHAKEELLSPREAWDQLRRCCEGMGPDLLDRFRDVLSGWSDWQPSEIEAMLADGGDEPSAAIDRWLAENA
jgi:hypothetical protein